MSKNILVLAPHTDDGELGCGGTINKLVEEGNNVFYVAFSACQQSVRKDLPSDILEKEVKLATEILGIKPENLILYDFEVRKFNYFRQDILEEMVKLERKLKPDMVFIPSVNDIHQDHHTIAIEGMRAFKRTTILAYEIVWNNYTFNSTGFFHLEERHVNKKIEALKEYKSQSHRDYLNEEFIRGLAISRGVQIGAKYAEVFDVVRMVVN